MRANDAHPAQGFISEHSEPRRVAGSSSPDAHVSYRQQMEALHNSLGEGLIATDEHGQITMVNAYAADCLGYQEEELLGQWFPKTIMAVDQHSQPIEKMRRPIIKALTTGRTVSESAHYLRKNGSMVPVFITVSPILVDEMPTGAIEIFRDLTKEQQLNVAKDEFVSLASHQLRTPATAVKSILAMLSAGDFGPLTEQQQKYIDKAALSNDRQLHVIESLLNVALVDAGRMELDLEYIDLAALLREAISDHVDATAGRNQAIALDTPPQCRLLVDVPKIRMVIDNLVSNASKYSEPGATIEIALRHTPHHAVLSVTDEGVGIPPSELSKLFSKFSRIDNEFSATVGGTGLGLFLAKHIVELHHGNISVRSQEGAGSTFTVALPTVWRSK
jgi:two-component system, OmpR family, sensor histidine kinase VicK